ncbi:MAG: ATP-binding protein [Pseudomonadota bacterium]
MFNSKLKTRLSFIISSVAVLLVTATGFVFMVREENHLFSVDHQKNMAAATALASECREPLLLGDVYRLHKVLTESIRLEGGSFYYAGILDQSGLFLMHSDLDEVGERHFDATNSRALQVFLPEVIHSSPSRSVGAFDDYIVPIIVGEVRLGTLVAGHSHYAIELEISRVKRQIFLVGLFATVIGILLANFLAARITAPLRQLTEATRRIARGEQDIAVDIDREDEFGDLARSFHFMTDELKKTTVSRDAIQNILDSAGDAIRFVDREKRTVRTNRAMADLLRQEGISASPVNCFNLLKGDFCVGEKCLLRRIEKGEKYVRMQASVTLHDGRSIFASIIATPVFENGKIVGIVESIQDISEWKKAEEQRRMLESQFLQAQKMEVVGRLASGVAHDFNNILTVIMGYSGVILENFDNRSPSRQEMQLVREKLQIIYDSGERAAALTRQLLAFSRKQVLSFANIDLRIVINQLVKMLRRLLGDDIKLTVQTGEEVSGVLADMSQIEQVIMNLAVNARDAMPKGGEIQIRTGNCTISPDFPACTRGEIVPGEYVLLSIRDNGVGIPKEIAEHIFEPFFTTKDTGRGTGLGLSTVYGIVQQHKGYITVDSAVNHGTTFHIYLPVSEKTKSFPVLIPDKGLRRGEETILVVDDDQNIRLVLKSMLSSFGYTILTAGDAAEAFGVFKSRHCDLVITDLIMEGRTGWELAQQVVKTDPGMKIIFMSGFTDENGDREKYFPESILLQKPVKCETVLEAISATLDDSS